MDIFGFPVEALYIKEEKIFWPIKADAGHKSEMHAVDFVANGLILMFLVYYDLYNILKKEC